MSNIAETCWWLKEALEHPEFRGDPAPALDRDIEADVVVVGGGYTGLWSAWQLVQRQPGIRVVVLERDECLVGLLLFAMGTIVVVTLPLPGA